jgi:hypothetical protein
MMTIRTATLAVCAALLAIATSAHAGPPANLANTVWNLLADQANTATPETLTINTQAGGTAPCRAINGVLGVANAPVNGFYCPADGRIHFIHKNASSKVPMRVFDGIVWATVAGLPYQMSGTYTSDYTFVKPFGYYGFSATKL